MYHWEWWLFWLLPIFICIILGILFYIVKRHRGHGYFLSKFSAFTRIRFDHLERRRQTYCPADDNCQCHVRVSAAHIEPNLSCSHRSPTLYMSFAGAAMIVGGLRTTEWRGSMRELHNGRQDDFDALFFTDPAQCFYLQDPNYRWDGLAYYRRLILIYSRLYKRVILIGASLGGSMVCMCADLATLSIAFNPILDPALLGLPWRVMGAFCPARQAHVVREQTQKTMEMITADNTGHNCVLHIHWSRLSAADQRQVHRIIGGGKKNALGEAKSFTTAFDFDINQIDLSSTSGVHIWFHQSTRHILPMYLKRTGELLPLLERHLERTDPSIIGRRSMISQRPFVIELPSSANIHNSNNHEVRLELM